jgi:transposase-like protein
MKVEIEFPETLQDAMKFFADEENAFAFMVRLRWPDGVTCPRCGAGEARFVSTRKIWECKHCKTKKQFSVRVGTIFEDSPIRLGKWWSAIWLIANAKNGISSCELHRSLGVTQKTAWFMLQRIRLALQNGSIVKIGGTVEVDETYIGGRSRSMNAKQRAKRRAKGTGQWNLTPVQGLLERTTAKRASRVILKHVANNKKRVLDPNVRQYVLKGATVNTDELKAYEGIGDEYTHNVINHAECYAKGHVHTNGLENFWSLLKRTIRGTYVSVEPFHLFRYLDEQAFRFNERKHEDGDKGRFLKAAAGIFGKGLRYAALIGQGKESETSAGAWQAA